MFAWAPDHTPSRPYWELELSHPASCVVFAGGIRYVYAPWRLASTSQRTSSSSAAWSCWRAYTARAAARRLRW